MKRTHARKPSIISVFAEIQLRDALRRKFPGKEDFIQYEGRAHVGTVERKKDSEFYKGCDYDYRKMAG